MYDDPRRNQEITARGSAPSIVQSFEVHGLYGYRTVSLASDYAATLLIARNGSGKTTLIGALDAFLRGQFTRLKDLDFGFIDCRLQGVPEPLILFQADLTDYLEVIPESGLGRLSRRTGIEVWSLFRFLVEDFPSIRSDYTALSENEIFATIRKDLAFRHSDAVANCEKILDQLNTKNLAIYGLLSHLNHRLSEIEVVYLPTYRRIELSLLEDERDSALRRRKKQKKFRFTGSSLYSGDIQFGLADISERLDDLNAQILSESAFGYREISANIITELLDGTADINNLSGKEIPDRSELSLFFLRVQEGRHGPFNIGSVPNIDKIYSGGVPDEANGFLRYFLSKLDTVIKSTRDRERLVEDFISVCNKYLSADDESTSLDTAEKSEIIAEYDDKKIVMDRFNLKIHALSKATGRKISINALSSGEKQMISLFAKLYLYPKNKIILIDEPELSLSMDWQRQILVDVLESPSCLQMIAITHSPFVFDNPLEPFARPLKLTYDNSGSSHLFVDEEFDLGE